MKTGEPQLWDRSWFTDYLHVPANTYNHYLIDQVQYVIIPQLSAIWELY